MKVSWLTALTFATAALAEPVLVPEQGQHVAPDQIADLEKRQYETQAAILDTLLAAIHIQTTEIRQSISRRPLPFFPHPLSRRPSCTASRSQIT